METMSMFRYTCLVFLLRFAPQPFLTSTSAQCDTNCGDKPSFTPSQLVVQYGRPLSATCTVCERECRGAHFDVEAAIGKSHKNQSASAVVWTVDRVTEWETSALCYYNDQRQVDHQCCTELHVTVYQPPTQVSIGLVGHTGPMLEGQRYTLQCAAQQAAPAEKLQAVFYRERTEVASRPPEGSRGLKEPQDKTFTLDFTPRREDNGATYWCKVSLDLDIPEGGPEVWSTNMTALVHYQPEVKTRSSDVISISVGDPLRLSCEAEGSPAPTYQWKHRSHHGSSSFSADFVINSTTVSDGGQYTCVASNSLGNVTLTFQVLVQANYIPYILGLMSALLLVLLIIMYVVHRKRRMGKYDFTLLRRNERR